MSRFSYFVRPDMVRRDVKMDRQMLYLIRSGMVRAMIPIQLDQDTAKSKETKHMKKEKKVKVRRINRNTKKWREFRKRFSWVEDLLEKDSGEGG